jgi:adhesin transport system outer membrane protein
LDLAYNCRYMSGFSAFAGLRFGIAAFLTVVGCSSLSSAFGQSVQTPHALTLTGAISQALITNPTFLAAEQQYTQAEAAVDEAKAGQHFTLTFNSQSGVSNAAVIQPPPSNETFAATQNSLTVPILVGSKPGLLVRQATEQLSESNALFQSAELSLATKVVGAYYDVMRKQALVTAALSDVATAKRELADAQARNKAGDIPQLDVLQAQVPVAANQAALLLAQRDSSISVETLNYLLGMPLDQSPLSITEITAPENAPSYSLDEARAMALSASPDLAASAAAVRAAEAALSAAKRYNDPALSLQAIDLRSGDQTSFSREDTLQASITVPLDDGGLGRASVRSATAALNQAQLNEDAARRTVLAVVSSAYLSVQSSLAEVTAAQEARDIAQTTYDKTNLGYAAGLYPLVNAITAENELAQTKAVYIQSVYDAASATSTLDIDVNGLSSGILEKTNKH